MKIRIHRAISEPALPMEEATEVKLGEDGYVEAEIEATPVEFATLIFPKLVGTRIFIHELDEIDDECGFACGMDMYALEDDEGGGTPSDLLFTVDGKDRPGALSRAHHAVIKNAVWFTVTPDGEIEAAVENPHIVWYDRPPGQPWRWRNKFMFENKINEERGK